MHGALTRVKCKAHTFFCYRWLMTQELVFFVSGSAPLPYRIVCTGEGKELRIRCSCRRGAIGRAMCKHVAALLMGDITAAVAGVEQLDMLAIRSSESPLVAAAFDYAPRHREVPQVDVSWTGAIGNEVAAEIEGLQALGYVANVSTLVVSVHPLTKHGKPRKRPALELRVSLDDPRPFSVWRDQSAPQRICYSSYGKVVWRFIEEARKLT